MHFEPDVDKTALPNPSSGLPGTVYAHKAFTDLGAPDTSDIAVIVLDAAPSRSLTPRSLASGPSTILKGAQLTVVGSRAPGRQAAAPGRDDALPRRPHP